MREDDAPHLVGQTHGRGVDLGFHSSLKHIDLVSSEKPKVLAVPRVGEKVQDRLSGQLQRLQVPHQTLRSRHLLSIEAHNGFGSQDLVPVGFQRDQLGQHIIDKGLDALWLQHRDGTRSFGYVLPPSPRGPGRLVVVVPKPDIIVRVRVRV